MRSEERVERMESSKQSAASASPASSSSPVLLDINRDCLLHVLEILYKESSLEERIRASGVSGEWRQLLSFILWKRQLRLGLDSELMRSAATSCPEKDHAVDFLDSLAPFFKSRIRVKCKSYRVIEGWKLKAILRKTPNLQVLNLPNCLLNQKVVGIVSRHCPRIEHLDFSNSRGLCRFNSHLVLTNLRHLNLRSSDVTEAAAKVLLNASSRLEALSISGPNISGDFLNHLPLKLNTLAFGGGNVSFDAFDAIHSMAGKQKATLCDLKLVDFEETPSILKIALFQLIVESFPKLKTLVFSNCGLNTSNFPLLDVRRLYQMQCFRIINNKTEDIIFGDTAILQMVENMSNLRCLQVDLVAWNFQTDPEAVFEAVARTCPLLKYLSVRTWVSLQDQSLTFLSFLKNLVYLDVGQISCFNKINLHGEVIQIVNSCKNLRVLRLNTLFPDADRFESIITNCREVASKRKGLGLQLEVPFTSTPKDGGPSEGFILSEYGHFCNSLSKYTSLNNI